MIWSGILAGYQVPKNCQNAVLGATLFAFSDAMILAKVSFNFVYHDPIIMSTYYLAQPSIAFWSVQQLPTKQTLETQLMHFIFVSHNFRTLRRQEIKLRRHDTGTRKCHATHMRMFRLSKYRIHFQCHAIHQRP